MSHLNFTSLERINLIKPQCDPCFFHKKIIIKNKRWCQFNGAYKYSKEKNIGNIFRRNNGMFLQYFYASIFYFLYDEIGKDVKWVFRYFGA